MSSISTNYIFNAALTVSSYAINLILFPYVTRVLGAEGIGQAGYVSECVNYFAVFSVLGIATVGTREIAACGQDLEKRSIVFSSLVSILMGTTGIVLFLYLCACFVVPRFIQDQNLFLLGSSVLVSMSFLMEWFYQGIERFKYITIRTLAIKMLYVVAVFILVRSKEDVIVYFSLTALMSVLNALVNILTTRRLVHFSFSLAKPFLYIRPVLILGAYGIMVSMYTYFTSVYLGFVASDDQVGYFYASKKLMYLILGFFSAFAAVMFPRISNLLADEQKEEIDKKISQSFDVVLSTSLPIVVFCEVFAGDIIRILSGPDFTGAVLPMRIIMPVLFFSAMAQIWVMQVLFPMRKDGIILLSSFLGAISGIVLSICLIRPLGAIGAACVFLISELAGNLYSFVYAVRRHLFTFPIRLVINRLLVAIPYLVICMLVLSLCNGMWMRLVVAAIASGIWFLVYYFGVEPHSLIAMQVKRVLSRFRS